MRLVFCLVLAWGSLSPVIAAETTAADSFNHIVETRIRTQLADLLQRLVTEERAMKIDGQPVFSGDDKFLPGKIALAFSDTLASLPADDPRRVPLLAGLKRVADLTVDDPNDSWGIYYYLSGLNTLQRHGMLDGALEPLTLAKLKVRLDWRTFVDTSNYTLIDHPNNYYCVAFAIARLRQRLGWEHDEGATKLYAAMIAHYEKYSGAFGFADETQGEGRFDRYSVLLAAEIAQRFMETDERPPAEVIAWVRKSADVMLMRLNATGEGFEYGRSLGPYGDSAIVEVLTAAARLGLLTDDEKSLAYAQAVRTARRYVDFWIDARTGSVNLWDGGRRTDAYRGKFRILGENLSLGHQFLYTNEAWNTLGFKDVSPQRHVVRARRLRPAARERAGWRAGLRPAADQWRSGTAHEQSVFPDPFFQRAVEWRGRCHGAAAGAALRARRRHGAHAARLFPRRQSRSIRSTNDRPLATNGARPHGKARCRGRRATSGGDPLRVRTRQDHANRHLSRGGAARHPQRPARTGVLFEAAAN